MTKRTYAEPVGVLVGCIVHSSPPLMMWLHLCPNGTHTVRVYENQKLGIDAFGATLDLAGDLGPQVLKVWQNQTSPPWYFIQLDEDYTPEMLCLWSLPWAVYSAWRRDKRIRGLV